MKWLLLAVQEQYETCEEFFLLDDI